MRSGEICALHGWKMVKQHSKRSCTGSGLSDSANLFHSDFHVLDNLQIITSLKTFFYSCFFSVSPTKQSIFNHHILWIQIMLKHFIDYFQDLANSLPWILLSDFTIEPYVPENTLRLRVIHIYGRSQNINTVYGWHYLCCNMLHWTQALTDNMNEKSPFNTAGSFWRDCES